MGCIAAYPIQPGRIAKVSNKIDPGKNIPESCFGRLRGMKEIQLPELARGGFDKFFLKPIFRLVLRIIVPRQATVCDLGAIIVEGPAPVRRGGIGRVLRHRAYWWWAGTNLDRLIHSALQGGPSPWTSPKRSNSRVQRRRARSVSQLFAKVELEHPKRTTPRFWWIWGRESPCSNA
jgi:hypothetical protein